MQVGSSTSSASQLQALENAALGAYQSNQDFSFLLQATQSGQVTGSETTDGSSGSSGSTSSFSSSGSSTSGSSSASSSSDGGWQLSGSITGGEVYAVGTMTGGVLQPFSQQQIQGELNAIDKVRQTAYADSLQNFMTLSEAGGQMGGGTYSDHVEFTADNGLVGGNFDTSFSLKPVGGAVPPTS